MQVWRRDIKLATPAGWRSYIHITSPQVQAAADRRGRNLTEADIEKKAIRKVHTAHARMWMHNGGWIELRAYGWRAEASTLVQRTV